MLTLDPLLFELTSALKNAHLHRRGKIHKPTRWRAAYPWPGGADCPKCQRTITRAIVAAMCVRLALEGVACRP